MPVDLCESSAAEGCITFEAAGEKVSCGFEFVSDETEAEEPGSHCVLGVFGLLGLGACALYCLCHVAECKAKLNVALELAGVNATLSSVAGCVELEESELNRALCEGRVEVEHVVAAAVVMLASSVVCVLCSVPYVCELRHRCGFVGVDRFKELSVNRSAVAAYAGAVKVEGLCEEALVACHDVCQVAKGFRCVAVGSDVDVNSAHSCGVALGAFVAKLAAKFLEAFNVCPGKDRGYKFALLVVGSGDAYVLLEFPFAALRVPCAPGAVTVAVCCVLVSMGSEEVCCNLGCGVSSDSVHLDLNSDGLLFHFLDKGCCSCVHFVPPLKSVMFLSVYTY